MKNCFSVIKKSLLFRGISDEEIVSMLKCLHAYQKTYPAENCIFLPDEKYTKLGLVLDGDVYISREDFWGNRTILTHIAEGGIFGEAWPYVPDESPLFGVTAERETSVLFLDAEIITSPCAKYCRCHQTMIRNLIHILAEENVQLTQKFGHLAHRSMREKLLSYLSEQAKRQKSISFEIPYNRQQLADYLCVDRSAMSAELSRMQKENLIRFTRNHFILEGKRDD